MNQPTLLRRARRFVQDLDDMGFGKDEPINGGDCVEFIDQNQQLLLRHLPALAELAEAAEACRVAGGSAEFFGKYEQLLAALDKLKGA